jgi:hypothetical protein
MLWLLVVVLALNVVYMQTLSGRLPERVATHFGFDGLPDGWMTRNGFLRFATIFPVVLSVFMVGIAYAARFFDPHTLHVANAAYWQQPEHYVEACNRLLAAMCVLASAMIVFLGAVWRIMAAAQSRDPVRIGKSALVVAALPFALFIALWIAWLSRSFELPH